MLAIIKKKIKNEETPQNASRRKDLVSFNHKQCPEKTLIGVKPEEGLLIKALEFQRT